jgi:ribosomal protein L7/L12
MLGIIGIVFVSAVFIFGLIVLVLTLAGARRRNEEIVPSETRTERLPPKQPGALLRQVNDSEIEREIRSGRVLNAIKLYQEKTGANMKDARDAVEAWRDRLSAS